MLKRQSETDQLAKARKYLAAARMGADKLKDGMKVRDDDIALPAQNTGGSSGSDRMTEESKTITSTAPKQTGPHFIPKLRGKKVVIRLVTGGQPITGVLEGYNAYEILIKTAGGQILVFKHSSHGALGLAQERVHDERVTGSSQSSRDERR